MVNKNKTNKIKIKHIEKYTLILLLAGYILGICIGAIFVFTNSKSIEFTDIFINTNNLNFILYFILALILKYSGILSGAICILPVFMGICNSINYCNYILNCENKIIYSTVLSLLKDTSICLLLIFYIIIIIIQISSQKYILRKDIKYLSAYILGAMIVNVLGHLLIKVTV